MKNRYFVLAVVLVGAVSFFLLKNRTATTQAPPAAEVSITAENFIRPHSPIFGNRLARATVVEWLDPECEACAAMHPPFKKIINEYQDRVRFVIRYMPFHGNSIYAASALEEARELGKYDQAMDILFERLPEWGDHHQPKPEMIPEILAKIGIPKEKLEREYLIQKHSEKVKIDEADGRKVGVRGTPTFFVNGRMLLQLGEEPLRLAIEEALK
jgi:protein-disulfide isomerase